MAFLVVSLFEARVFPFASLKSEGTRNCQQVPCQTWFYQSKCGSSSEWINGAKVFVMYFT